MGRLGTFIKSKWGYLAGGFAVGLAVAMVVTLSPINLQVDTQYESVPQVGTGERQIAFTMGTTAYAAGVADYTCDGTDDDVQFQDALDALPGAGGKLVVLAGTYSFSDVVERAIDNVTVQGVGRSAYITRDGANPCFSAGVQSNWVFRDLRFDAGGVNVALATGWVKENVLEGADYVAYDTSSDITADEWAIPSGRVATLVVAASNASSWGKAQADYVCDGTNDEVQIETAMAALPQLTRVGASEYHGRVLLLEGTYHIGATIDFPARSITLVGQGQGTVLRAINSLNDNIINLASYSNITIEHLFIDGNHDNNSSGIAIEMVATVNCMINDVYIQDAADHAIRANSNVGTALYLSQVYVNGCINHACEIYDYKGVTIINSVFEKVETADQAGLTFNNVVGGMVIGTWAEQNTYGFNISGTSKDITIEGCTLRSNTSRGIITGTDTEDLIFTGATNALNTTEDLLLRGDNCIVIGGDYPAGITNTGAGNRFYNVPDYIDENSGKATLLNGNTTIEVAHGLSATPTVVLITFAENPDNVIGDWWVDTLGVANFTFNGVDPGASNLDFYWEAKVR